MLRSASSYGVKTQRSAVLRLVIALLTVCVRPAAGYSQSIRQTSDTTLRPGRIVLSGVVRDEAGRGITGAQVQMASNITTITDDSGAFPRRELPADTIRVIVRRIGYDSAMLLLPLVQPRMRHELTITLHRTYRLSTIEVEGKSYDRLLWDKGFYQRQRTASGSFFDPDFLAHFGGSGLGSLVREVQRIDVRRINNQDYAFSTVGGSPCRMNVFIDGAFQRIAMPSPYGGQEGMGLGELIGFRDVYAVEVYPRVNFVPQQFVRMGPGAGPAGRSTPKLPSPNGMKSSGGQQGENQDAACGAIVIWTRPVIPDASGGAPPAAA